MGLFDRVKKLFDRGNLTEVVTELEEAGEPLVPANREYIRAVRRSQRLKGPGYTRKMRKGRTQRERPENRMQVRS